MLRLPLDLSSLIFRSWVCGCVSGLKINIAGDTNLDCADLAAAVGHKSRDIAFFPDLSLILLFFITNVMYDRSRQTIGRIYLPSVAYLEVIPKGKLIFLLQKNL